MSDAPMWILYSVWLWDEYELIEIGNIYNKLLLNITEYGIIILIIILKMYG